MSDSTSPSGLASLSGIVALGNPRSLGTSPNSKLIELDAQFVLGPDDDDTLFGALRLWNSNGLTFSEEEVGLYQVSCSFAKAEVAAIVEPSGDVSDYQFVGDIHDIVYLGSFDNSGINHQRPPFIVVGGITANINSSDKTFDVDVPIYLPACKDTPALRPIAPFRCSFADIPKWSKKKPLPYAQRYVTIAGHLTGVLFKEATKQPKQSEAVKTRVLDRFCVSFRDIAFMGSTGSPSSKTATTANTLDTPTKPVKSGKALFNGRANKGKAAAAPPPAIIAAAAVVEPALQQDPAPPPAQPVAGPSRLTRGSNKRARVEEAEEQEEE